MNFFYKLHLLTATETRETKIISARGTRWSRLLRYTRFGLASTDVLPR